MKDMSISKALMWLFIAEVLGILTIIPIVGAILGIIGFVMTLLALYGAGKLDSGYKTAFILSVVGLVVSVVAAIVGDNVFGTILDIISTVISLGILYYVVMTTVNHLGGSDVAAKGVTVWKLNMICTIASVVLTILGLIAPVLAAVLLVIVFIVEIVAAILYMIFLYKASKALA